MAGYTASAKETAALAITNLGAYISVHTADPGLTGTSEATGGSPAYARKLTTWTGGTADGVVTGSEVTHNLPAGTYSYIGIWSAATAGTYIGGAAITSTTLPAQGTLLITPTVSIS